MNFSRHLYLVFLLSILAPGLILAYLSLRTVKDERILIEKSLENRNEEFLEAVDRMLDKTKAEHLARLQDQLQRSSSSSSPDNYLFLATDILENPLIQSLAIFRQEDMVFPRRLQYMDSSDASQAAPDSLELPPRARDAVTLIQFEYRTGRYLHALRMIRSFSHAAESILDTRAGSLYRYGLWLLEIKCLVDLNLTDEAVIRGRDLIQSLLRADGFSSYHEVKFYLSETVNLLTSLETLPREVRDYFWSIHQRAEVFLVNAEFVSQEWKTSPEFLIRSQALDFQSPIQINYLEGIPYVIIGYPWLDKETRIIARLNESVFSEVIRSDIVQAKKSAWKDMDFALLNQRDQVVLTTDSLADRRVALERNLSGDFPAWKIVIFKKKESEVMALGRRKLTLLYTLLGFALAALLIGSLFVFQGLKNERRIVRMKSNFLSAVSHELKTPLTSIRMFAEILESGKQTQEDKRKRYFQLIGEEATRLYHMIEGILNFTRLEEGRAQFSFASLDLTNAVQEVAGLMAGAYEKAGIRLVLQLDPEVRINADYDSIRSVIQNLLENSLKYSQPGTAVTVQLENASDKAGGDTGKAVLRVKDQGIGIAGSDVKRIFDKFYRAGDEMTRRTKGSGLGLSIVKQILDTHKAQIRVNSKLNEGTEMVITFDKNASGPARVEKAMHKILIVEDEEAIRLGLVDLLEIEGYEIDVAVDGEQAMEQVRLKQPELVILDLMLPKVSGYDVCRYIRKTFPHIFILMLTAKNEEINKIQGLEMGADDYVTKPFSVFELMARIKSLLRRVSLEKTPAVASASDVLEFDDVRIDFKKYEAHKSGASMDLSAKEFQILKYLATRRGEVVTREDLLQAIWGYSADNMPTTRTVDNQIVKLRQKVENDIGNPTVIKSVRGVGYKFDPSESKE